jgi:hypothetical protein
MYNKHASEKFLKQVTKGTAAEHWMMILLLLTYVRSYGCVSLSQRGILGIQSCVRELS